MKKWIKQIGICSMVISIVMADSSIVTLAETVSDNTVLETQEQEVHDGQEIIDEENDIGCELENSISFLSLEEDSQFLSVKSAEDLMNISEMINKGDNDCNNIVLNIENDINMENVNWKPLGASSNYPFRGSIQGNGHKIVGLTCGSGYAGIIGYWDVSSEAFIKNLTIENLKLKGANSGGLAANVNMLENAKINIESVNIQGDVSETGIAESGGLFAQINTKDNSFIEIKKCVINVNLVDIGGGFGHGTPTSGGLIGHALGTGTIKADSCSFDGTVYGKNSYGYSTVSSGGIIGNMEISNVYLNKVRCAGRIESVAYFAHTGGLIGILNMDKLNRLEITNTYVKAQVAPTCINGTSQGGGFIGRSAGNGGQKIVINNSYSAGSIDARNKAAFICWHEDSVCPYIANSYYDKNVSGLSTNQMVCNLGLFSTTWLSENISNSNGLSTAEMGDVTNYNGWDFKNIWIMKDGYPELRWYSGDSSENDENSNNSPDYGDTKEWRNSLPKLSDEDAAQFIAFIYNSSDYLNADHSDDMAYNLLTGRYAYFDSDEEIRSAIIVFSDIVRTNLNMQLSDSSRNVEYLSDNIVDYLEDELKKHKNIDDEIVSEVSGKVSKTLKKSLIEFFSSHFSMEMQLALPNAIDDLELMISGYDELVYAPQKATEYVERMVATIEGAFLILNFETNGRADYFVSYLVGRKIFDSSNDSGFQALMAGEKARCSNNSEYASLLWFTGNDPWYLHSDEIDRWAETTFQLEESLSRYGEIEGNVLYEGELNSTVDWKLYDTGCLIISGEGEASSGSFLPPWSIYANQITSVYISEGISSIGADLFANLSNNVTEIVLPKSIKRIDSNAFEGYSQSTKIDYYGLYSDWIHVILAEGNDVFQSIYEDTDDDFIPDIWELYGADVNNDGIVEIPLNEMGAVVGKKDIFVEIDWMEVPVLASGKIKIGKAKNYGPNENQLRMVWKAFDNHDINLHLDAGPNSIDYVTGKKWGALSGGNVIEYINPFPFPEGALTDDPIIKANFSRHPSKYYCSSFENTIFKYCIWGNQYSTIKDGVTESSGAAYIGRLDKPFIFIANQSWVTKGGDISCAGTFMHELGHTIGLTHGGPINCVDEDQNFKPNYISVMNYAFQNTGITINNHKCIDYSVIKLEDLDESKLLEKKGVDTEGLYPANSKAIFYLKDENNDYKEIVIKDISGKAIDFNQNGYVDEGLLAPLDLNKNGKSTDILVGAEDWTMIPTYFLEKNSAISKGEYLSKEKTLQEALQTNSLADNKQGNVEFVGLYTIDCNRSDQLLFFDIVNPNKDENSYTFRISGEGILDAQSINVNVDGSVEKLEKKRVSILLKDNLPIGKYQITYSLFNDEAKEVNRGSEEIEVISFTQTEIDTIQSEDSIDLQIKRQYYDWGDVNENDRKPFEENGQIPNGVWITKIKPQTYTGSALTPDVRVYDNNKLLKETVDYEISYKNNINVNDGTESSTAPTITVMGKGNYSGKSTQQAFAIVPCDIRSKEISISDITVNENGEVQKPSVIVKRNEKELKDKTDYIVSYPDDVDGAYKNPGDWKIVVSGINGYQNNREVTLHINEYSDTSDSKPETPITPPPNESKPQENAETQIRAFVSRMYTVALGREAEQRGLDDWSNQLLEHTNDGAGLARGFICSAEFTNKNLSNDAYVNTLYRTFFDREPDFDGKVYWIAALNRGTKRNEVLAGFVNSLEFANLCDSYGIARGTMESNGSSIYNADVRNYVLRMYTKCLKRDGETLGVEDWSHRINTKAMNPESVAKSFFTSEEFLNKNLSNEDYVETLYETFMDRPSDAAGKADWVNKLNSGVSRQTVLEGFSRSPEFAKIMASFGL